MKTIHEDELRDDELIEMKRSILILMIAAGHNNAKNINPDRSINEMLASFSVESENAKKGTMGAPGSSTIGAISKLEDCGLVSTERKVATKMGCVYFSYILFAISHTVCVGDKRIPRPAYE